MRRARVQWRRRNRVHLARTKAHSMKRYPRRRLCKKRQQQVNRMKVRARGKKKKWRRMWMRRFEGWRRKSAASWRNSMRTPPRRQWRRRP